jgi:hypothetical protein
VIITLTLVSLILPVALTIPYFLQPNLPIYLPTVFPDKWQNTRIVNWGFALVLLYGTICLVGMMWVYYSVIAAYFCE